MFANGSSSSISLATVTPSWVTVGAPNFLSSATLRPLGPRVVLTALARVSTPSLRERRACSLNSIIFATECSSVNSCYRERIELTEDRQDVLLRQDQVLLFLELEFGASIFGEQNLIPDRNVDRNAIAIVIQATCPHRDDGAALRLLLGRVREDDAALGGLFTTNRP